MMQTSSFSVGSWCKLTMRPGSMTSRYWCIICHGPMGRGRLDILRAANWAIQGRINVAWYNWSLKTVFYLVRISLRWVPTVWFIRVSILLLMLTRIVICIVGHRLVTMAWWKRRCIYNLAIWVVTLHRIVMRKRRLVWVSRAGPRLMASLRCLVRMILGRVMNWIHAISPDFMASVSPVSGITCVGPTLRALRHMGRKSWDAMKLISHVLKVHLGRVGSRTRSPMIGGIRISWHDRRSSMRSSRKWHLWMNMISRRGNLETVLWFPLKLNGETIMW